MVYLRKEDCNCQNEKLEKNLGIKVDFTYLPPNILGLFDFYKKEIQVREAEDNLTKLETLVHEIEHFNGKDEIEARIATENELERLFGIQARFQLPQDYRSRLRISRPWCFGYD